MNKNDIRKKVKLMRNSLSDTFVREKSQLIADEIFSNDTFKKANVIMAYYSMSKEVNTKEIIQRLIKIGKKVVLPACNADTKELVALSISSLSELHAGIYGIMEPIIGKHMPLNLKEIDIILVPGIAFDRLGNRIGHGRGYYDRFLAALNCSQLKIGLCFDFQLFNCLPAETLDVPVDWVFTENEIFAAKHISGT